MKCTHNNCMHMVDWKRTQRWRSSSSGWRTTALQWCAPVVVCTESGHGPADNFKWGQCCFGASYQLHRSRLKSSVRPFRHCCSTEILRHRHHDNTSTSRHYVNTMTIRHYHDNTSTPWQYVNTMTIRQHYDNTPTPWQYVSTMTIRRQSSPWQYVVRHHHINTSIVNEF